MVLRVLSHTAFGTCVLIRGHKLKLAVTDDDHCWLWSHCETCHQYGWWRASTSHILFHQLESEYIPLQLPHLPSKAGFQFPPRSSALWHTTFRKWPISFRCFKITAQKLFVTIKVRDWRSSGAECRSPSSDHWEGGLAGLKFHPFLFLKKISIWWYVTTGVSPKGNVNPLLANLCKLK